MSKWPVLLLVDSLGHGGCERDATKIAVGLDRNRFEPHIAVFHAGGFLVPQLEAAGVPILSLPLRSFVNSSARVAARQMGDYIRDHGIRLVHAFDVPSDIFAAPVARWYGVPAVVTSQLSYRSMYASSRRAALRLTDWLSDRIVTNSQAGILVNFWSWFSASAIAALLASCSKGSSEDVSPVPSASVARPAASTTTTQSSPHRSCSGSSSKPASHSAWISSSRGASASGVAG
jgi:hypothetical protein